MSDTGRTHLFKIGLNDPFGYIHSVPIVADNLHIFRIGSNGVSKYRMASSYRKIFLIVYPLTSQRVIIPGLLAIAYSEQAIAPLIIIR
jgi:hypothetical protein